MSDPYDSSHDTKKHRFHVECNLRDVMASLEVRAHEHDRSKLEYPEKTGYDLLGQRQRGLTYGSPEYFAQFNEIPEMAESVRLHYAANAHHPEHHVMVEQDGIARVDKIGVASGEAVSRMSLLDLVEMVADWKAATLRHDDGNLPASLEHNAKRFGLSPQLARIIENTVRELGW